ncbi:UNVERIFIED_CONTAM: holin [Bacteriophage sp.]
MMQLLKSKTVWYAIIIAVLSVVQCYLNLLPMTPVAQMFVGIAISVGIVILRLLTTQPIGDK